MFPLPLSASFQLVGINYRTWLRLPGCADWHWPARAMPWFTTTMAGGFSMLAKQEDVGSSSPKLDHHASRRIDDQSPTFSSFSLRFPVKISDRPPWENLCVFQAIDFIARVGSSSLPQTLEFGRALSGVSVLFLFMLSSANDRVWESFENSTLSSANVRVWESLELFSVLFLFMLSSANDRVWESFENSTLSSANVRVWESLELFSVLFLFMLSSANDRVWESFENSTLSSANVRVWESLELVFVLLLFTLSSANDRVWESFEHRFCSVLYMGDALISPLLLSSFSDMVVAVLSGCLRRCSPHLAMCRDDVRAWLPTSFSTFCVIVSYLSRE